MQLLKESLCSELNIFELAASSCIIVLVQVKFIIDFSHLGLEFL